MAYRPFKGILGWVAPVCMVHNGDFGHIWMQSKFTNIIFIIMSTEIVYNQHAHTARRHST